MNTDTQTQKIPSFPLAITTFKCIRLINTIFPTWLEGIKSHIVLPDEIFLFPFHTHFPSLFLSPFSPRSISSGRTGCWVKEGKKLSDTLHYFFISTRQQETPERECVRVNSGTSPRHITSRPFPTSYSQNCIFPEILWLHLWSHERLRRDTPTHSQPVNSLSCTVRSTHTTNRGYTVLFCIQRG